MNKNLFIILGALVALLPFVSVPNSFKTPIYVALGAGVAITSYRERYMKKKPLGLVSSRRFKKIPSTSPVANDISISPTSSDETTINKEVQ